MAAAIPRPSRPSYGPPTTALPALPTSKTRKSTGGIPAISDFKSTSTPSLPKSGLRAPSTSNLPSSPGGSVTLPKLRTTPGVNGAGRSIRKTISINSFPQPPRGDGPRITSLPPSPLSGGLGAGSRADSDTSPATPGPKKLKRLTSTSSSKTSYVNGAAPSLLNGSGDSRSISSGPGARGSDGLLSLPSPPQSRSSSAQDSYSTSATTLEDNGDLHRGREAAADADTEKGSSKHGEIKGNVIVSVRVRPDAGGGERGKADGEWLVDGRKSLVSYRGKEAGDYYYGKEPRTATHSNELTRAQIMFLLPTTTMPRSTMLLRSDWFGELWKDTTELSSPTG
jgi:centromeric protein E